MWWKSCSNNSPVQGDKWNKMSLESVNIIGAGLAGSEAALYLANHGVAVRLHEMKPHARSKAHTLDSYCELVCNNFLCSDSKATPLNMLFREITLLGSEVVKHIQAARVDDKRNIAVDGLYLSQYVTKAIKDNPWITVINTEVVTIPDDRPTIIATGPLTSENLLPAFVKHFNGSLSFHDANSIVLDSDSLDKSQMEKISDDVFYIHLSEAECTHLENIAKNAETAHAKTPYTDEKGFIQCLPVETLAEKHGKLAEYKLSGQKEGAYATIILRRDSRFSSNAFVISEFTTDMKHPYQDQTIHSIRGLSNAKIVRYGAYHEDTYIDAPKNLNSNYEVVNDSGLYVIGQLSGIDGYLPAISSGVVAARSIIGQQKGRIVTPLPTFTMIGALGNYVSTPKEKKYEPMIPLFDMLPQEPKDYKARLSRSLDYLTKIKMEEQL